MLKSLLAASLLLSSVSVFAVDRSPAIVKNATELEQTITSVTVEEIESYDLDAATPTTPIGEIISILDGLLAIGKKIWPIIEAGRPVINTKMSPAVSVIPNIDGTNVVLNEMANWSVPKVQSYKVTFKNTFGGSVVSFVYSIIFQHSGNYNGVGKYITGLRVQASQITASWGFDFNANSELMSIANVGSKEQPLASAVINIAYAVRGKLNEMRTVQSFYIDGNGNVQLLNN